MKMRKSKAQVKKAVKRTIDTSAENSQVRTACGGKFWNPCNDASIIEEKRL